MRDFKRKFLVFCFVFGSCLFFALFSSVVLFFVCTYGQNCDVVACFFLFFLRLFLTNYVGVRVGRTRKTA